MTTTTNHMQKNNATKAPEQDYNMIQSASSPPDLPNCNTGLLVNGSDNNRHSIYIMTVRSQPKPFILRELRDNTTSVG